MAAKSVRVRLVAVGACRAKVAAQSGNRAAGACVHSHQHIHEACHARAPNTLALWGPAGTKAPLDQAVRLLVRMLVAVREHIAAHKTNFWSCWSTASFAEEWHYVDQFLQKPEALHDFHVLSTLLYFSPLGIVKNGVNSAQGKGKPFLA
eukprot:1159267-Pelagomonas_calceolata.AAC.2